MLASYDRVTERVERRSVNACLRPLASIDGMAVTTIEGIGNSRDGLNPIQQRLADGNGSQCGYCSPGFVMTAYTYLSQHERPSERAIEDLFAGNLCRCTGYRPILESMRSFAAPPHASGVAADVFPDELLDHPLRPLRFAGGGRSWYRATTLAMAQALKQQHYRAANDPKLVNGNTSIGIYKADVDDPCVLIDVAGIDELRRIAVADDGATLEIGGGVTYARLLEFLPTLHESRPAAELTGLDALHDTVAQIAGTQVRDAATVGGAVSLLSQHAASQPVPVGSLHRPRRPRRDGDARLGHVRRRPPGVRRARAAARGGVAARRSRRRRRRPFATPGARRELPRGAPRAERPRARQRLPAGRDRRRRRRRACAAGLRRDRRAAAPRAGGRGHARRPAVGAATR